MWGSFGYSYSANVANYTGQAPTTAASTTQIRFLVSEQRFNISITGLQPSTVHYFYFERSQVSASKLKPIGGKLGDPLLTTAAGTLTFDFYHTADLPQTTTTVDNAQRLALLVAGTKEVVVTSENISKLPTGFETTYMSFWKDSIVVEVTV